jgi:hypothetical protein
VRSASNGAADALSTLRDVVARRIVGINVVEHLYRTTVVADRPKRVGRRQAT